MLPVLLLSLCAALRAAQASCPPSNFSTQQGFKLSDYISRPWYSVQQAPNSYQQRDNLYCVRAEYRRDPRDSSRILVFNQARRGSVTGELQGTGMLLNAIVKDENQGKLAVGPSFLPTNLYGPYWVVAFGGEWAIISGGAPTQQGQNGTCKTGSSGPAALLTNPNGNGEGLWLFFREPTPAAPLVQSVRDVAASKGFDLSVLVPVPQQGCTYAQFPADAPGGGRKLFGAFSG